MHAAKLCFPICMQLTAGHLFPAVALQWRTQLVLLQHSTCKELPYLSLLIQKKMRKKSVKFLAAKCSTHAVLAVVLYREFVFSSNPMWSRPNWSCDVRYHLPGLRSSLVWRVTGSLSLLPISLTVEPTLGPCRMELAR